METIQPTSLGSMGVTNNETMLMTTATDDLVTYEHVTDGINPTYEDVITGVSDDEGIFTGKLAIFDISTCRHFPPRSLFYYYMYTNELQSSSFSCFRAGPGVLMPS